MRRTSLLTTLFLGLGILAATGAAAQIPEQFTNLQVLPKDIPRSQLIDTMREMAGSLGVRCANCHVGPDNLQGMDFASDEKPTKRTARAMLKLVAQINDTSLKGLETGRSEVTRVRCITCHRGLTVPKTIDEILARSIEARGVAAALTEYRELRTKHYGSGAYDFSQGPLNFTVEKLSRERKLDDALAVATLDVEFNPDAPYPWFLLGRLQLARGDKPAAIAALEKAVARDPTTAQAKKQLDELKAAPPPPS